MKRSLLSWEEEEAIQADVYLSFFFLSLALSLPLLEAVMKKELKCRQVFFGYYKEKKESWTKMFHLHVFHIKIHNNKMREEKRADWEKSWTRACSICTVLLPRFVVIPHGAPKSVLTTGFHIAFPRSGFRIIHFK